MPKLGNDIETFKTPQNYTFSGVRAEDLGASEYTLVNIVVDISGSIANFVNELRDCVKTIYETCNDPKNPRRDNLLFRVVRFDNRVEEHHGFQMLGVLNPNDYDNLVIARGSTALYDSAHTTIDAALVYAKDLSKQGVVVNAINFVLTDGCDNASKYSPSEIANLVDKAKKNEYLESIINILIGVSCGDASVKTYLDRFHTEAKFDQFIDIGTADKKTLMKLAEFVSKSISSQSQALNSGSASKTLPW